MKRVEYIKRYGQAAYEKKQQQNRDWYAQHRERCNARSKTWAENNPEKTRVNTQAWKAANPDKVKANHQAWCEANPEKVRATNQEQNRKGGKRYEDKLKYMRTGLQGERNKVRNKHNVRYRAAKQATPNSVLHDEWIYGTAKYRGLALVDKELHQRGIIKVIKVLEGEITLFTEKEIREQKGGKRNDKKRMLGM